MTRALLLSDSVTDMVMGGLRPCRFPDVVTGRPLVLRMARTPGCVSSEDLAGELKDTATKP